MHTRTAACCISTGTASCIQIHHTRVRVLQASASSESAVDFIVRAVNQSPGEVTILALAACTNIALALQKDPLLHTKWKELVVLGGAFHINGNVTPAAEANIIGDAEAADYVFARGTNTYVVGLDVTMDCSLTKEQLELMRGEQLPGFSSTSACCHAAHQYATCAPKNHVTYKIRPLFIISDFCIIALCPEGDAVAMCGGGPTAAP